MSKKFLHIIGTRPNIMKLCPIKKDDIICWTGQHYDVELKDNLLKEFNIVPNHMFFGSTLANILQDLNTIINDDIGCVVVYGDTRSTLAGALVAKEFGVKLAHVEAGIRTKYSNRYEESVRRSVDQISDYLFAIDEVGANNLKQEGVLGKVFIVGDPMYQTYCEQREHKGYILATFHRGEHVGSKAILKGFLSILDGYDSKIIFPIHPRTAKAIKDFKLEVPKNVELIKPVGYKEMIDLIKHASLVITDSGGVTREAGFAGTPVYSFEVDEWKHLERPMDAKNQIKEILIKEVCYGSKN